MAASLLTDWQARLPATVDAVNARLPQFYAAAKDALARCVELDEVKHWSDRSAALATYARQANDRSLQTMAQRIHLRAVARIGELLLQIPPSKGGHHSGRYKAASDAGLSSRNTTKALAIARIPRQEREPAIDADPPPSVRALEQMAPPSPDTPAHTFKAGSEFYRKLSRDSGGLFGFCAWARRTELPGRTDLTDEERERVLANIRRARHYLRALRKLVL